MTHPVTIVPLGPGDPSLLTLGSLRALKECGCVILRTARHGTAPFLTEEGVSFTALDELYDQYEDFDALNDAINTAEVFRRLDLSEGLDEYEI